MTNWIGPFILASLFNATPLALVALGGVLSERAGVVNIALEGLMLAGAFVGVWAGQSSSAAGLIAALLAGGALGLLHAFLTQKFNMDHVVSGLGITLFAYGSTHFLFQRFFPPSGVKIAGVSSNLFLVLAILLPFAVAFLLKRTKFGLRLRAVGESPESARLAGIAPIPVRFVAVTLSGVFAALGGAYLSMGNTHAFSPEMSAGKGYIALAAVIFGKWSPLGAALGALFFGVFEAMQSQLQISGLKANFLGVEWTSPYLLHCLPYVMTLAALVTVIGRATPPAALGKED